VEAKLIICPVCKGEHTAVVGKYYNGIDMIKPCKRCNGTGKVIKGEHLGRKKGKRKTESRSILPNA